MVLPKTMKGKSFVNMRANEFSSKDYIDFYSYTDNGFRYSHSSKFDETLKTINERIKEGKMTYGEASNLLFILDSTIGEKKKIIGTLIIERLINHNSSLSDHLESCIFIKIASHKRARRSIIILKQMHKMIKNKQKFNAVSSQENQKEKEDDSSCLIDACHFVENCYMNLIQ